MKKRKKGSGIIETIPLGKKPLFALVDDQDYELISSFAWFSTRVRNKRYAVRAYKQTPRGELMFMHKVITGFDMTDHVNGDGLDNRRSNLRIANHSQNGANACLSKSSSTGFKGVSRWKGRYRAKIYINRTQVHLGYFATAEEAAVAYNQAALEAWGEYAKVNVLDEGAENE